MKNTPVDKSGDGEARLTPAHLDDSLLAAIEDHAIEITRQAGAIVGSYFGGPLDVEYKDKKKQDPVTIADRVSQEYLGKAIAKQFPDHGVLGEEDPEMDDSPAPYFLWVLDPLDGTKNFMSGLPVYACSVGVLYRGSPVVGAVFVPWPCDGGGVVLHARRGGGAFMEAEGISVLESDEPKGNLLTTLPAFFGGAYRFRKPMRGHVGEVRVTGSIAYELAMTARGVLQYSVTTAPRVWDVAGGAMLVKEAGGLVLVGRQPRGVRAVLPTTAWEPLESFVPMWQPGVTTMKELRRWSAPVVVGSPGVARYVTSNMRTKLPLRHRLARVARRPGRVSR
jgi:myo-inositol-1(or 4)-monophosphatase